MFTPVNTMQRGVVLMVFLVMSGRGLSSVEPEGFEPGWCDFADAASHPTFWRRVGPNCYAAFEYPLPGAARSTERYLFRTSM